jgi:hypothetical protein
MLDYTFALIEELGYTEKEYIPKFEQLEEVGVINLLENKH